MFANYIYWMLVKYVHVRYKPLITSHTRDIFRVAHAEFWVGMIFIIRDRSTRVDCPTQFPTWSPSEHGISHTTHLYGVVSQ